MKISEQIKNLIDKSQNILILISPEAEGDSFTAALSLSCALKNMGKELNLFYQKIPEKLNFLPALNEFPNLSEALNIVGDNLVNATNIVSINVSKCQIKEVCYEKNESDLKFLFSVAKGELEETDISFKKVFKEPDVIITVGLENLEKLDKIFEKNSKFFFEKPIINIDNKASNENFGEINLVEITSPTVSEIVANLINNFDEKTINKNIATCLLTGIISGTSNFKQPSTTPDTLEFASWLVEKGADHQKIIQHLYKSNSLNEIRLFGRILEKINYSKEKEIAWAILTDKDFKELGCSPKDLKNVLKKINSNFPNSTSILILWESPSLLKKIKGTFYSPKNHLIKKIIGDFGGNSKNNWALLSIDSESIEKTRDDLIRTLNLS